ALYGYKRLDPVPSPAELEAFYTGSYMELIEAGGRAPEIRRLLQGGPEREAELAWLRSTLYSDVELALAPGGGDRGLLLDVGCGTGDFLDHARSMGWGAEGVEPSRLASERARERGFKVFTGTLEAYREQGARPEWDAVSLLNVLEHVPDPARYVHQCRELLRPEIGRLAVVVPNDFSEVQAAAAQALGTAKRWWVAAPDHINYFDFVSLERLLQGAGFQVEERTCTFPMELFLMMGDDYVTRPELGRECHARRRKLESAMPAELRRRLYRALASEGLGRNCVVVARRVG
ncbi:MAG: class I SAM-dependent methyltransferase, partial [Deltaproteobacteria bacterium]|nr:class I SAM-dependent methyltransferase [Deltaproteobacteria bacterium]